MPEKLYTLAVLRLAASLARWPLLDAPHGWAERRSPTCGSRVRVDVALDGNGRIATIGLGVSACALGQASAAILAGQAANSDLGVLVSTRAALARYLGGEDTGLPDWPAVDTLAAARDYPARHASILLPFDAAIAAVEAAAETERAR